MDDLFTSFKGEKVFTEQIKFSIFLQNVDDFLLAFEREYVECTILVILFFEYYNNFGIVKT